MNKIIYIGKCVVMESEGKRIVAGGDLHLGYEEALNKSGVMFGRGRVKEIIREFEEVIDKAGKVDEVVLLGDIKHVFGTVLRQERKEIEELIDSLRGKEERNVVIVKGNHDSMIEAVVRGMDVEVKNVHISGEIAFAHGDRDFKEMHGKKIKTWVIAHGHPAVKLSDGVKIERYKCFLVGNYEGRKVVIVPSFIDYSEGSDPRENKLGLAWELDIDKFEVKIIGEKGEALDFGKLGKLSSGNIRRGF